MMTARPIVDPKTLSTIFRIILTNSGCDALTEVHKGVNRVICVNDDNGVFLTAYQSMYLATPLCYEVEPWDGKTYKVYYEDKLVIEVTNNNKVVN